VASLTLTRRQSSFTGTPASASFNTPTICSSLNRLFLIGASSLASYTRRSCILAGLVFGGQVNKLSIERLSKESPLLILAVVAALPAAATTIWALAQTFEKVANFPLNREILKLNRDKLRQELQGPHPPVANVLGMTDANFIERVHIREAEYTYERIERHLEGNPVRVREIEVRYTRHLPQNRGKKE
jgi:hypothetical protein